MKSLTVLISNPAAKKTTREKIERATHFLRSRGYEIESLMTKQKGDAEIFAREALRKSPSLIIAAGGDGTFNEVANGMAGSEVPLAIVPLGTTNVLAKEAGIPENVENALGVAVSHTPNSISLGKIVFTHHSSLITRYFLLMAGVGFDGEAVHGMNETIKKISGKGAYFYSGFRTLIRFHPGRLTLTIDGRSYSGYSVIIGNAAKYGGNFRITPDARLSDPCFYVCLFEGRGRLDILRYVFGVTTGKHLGFRDVRYLKAEHVEIKGDAHIQTDGDYLGKTPAKIEVARDALKLIF
jgi:YegS/Rv2252/BmrU family lipid kinase